jgi:hypothetical protein
MPPPVLRKDSRLNRGAGSHWPEKVVPIPTETDKSALEDHPIEPGSEPGEGARAVAELVLDQRAELPERPVILGDQEQGS